MPRDDHRWRPAAGRDAQPSKLGWYQRTVSRHTRHVRVDAIHEGGDNRGASRMIVLQLGRHRAAIAQQSRCPVACNPAWPQDLGHRARGLATPELELKQPVARRVVALREKQIMLIARSDVHDARGIARHCHRCSQSSYPERLCVRTLHSAKLNHNTSQSLSDCIVDLAS